MTDNNQSSPFWYMCRGVENMPITMAGLTLPNTARLQLVHTRETVQAGSLVTFANIGGKAGLLRQTNLVINSTNYAYQEGCVSAIIDGTQDLWMSSGLEDYFLGAYFHSMPTEHLPFSGFELQQPATSEPEKIPLNSLSAYRIHDPDPVLFTKSLQFQWIASSDNRHKNDGFCNYDFPSAPIPTTPPGPSELLNGTISVDALAWVYVWDQEE
mmetsp:Transcript_4922/g.12749  ORF Transcript_4922/g.12749 Transcript_4922/m.12749 type:complete len:212 (+) Transcript_4922:585-1220(+)